MPGKAEGPLGKDVAAEEMREICAPEQADKNVSLAKIGVCGAKQ